MSVGIYHEQSKSYLFIFTFYFKSIFLSSGSICLNYRPTHLATYSLILLLLFVSVSRVEPSVRHNIDITIHDLLVNLLSKIFYLGNET